MAGKAQAYYLTAIGSSIRPLLISQRQGSSPFVLGPRYWNDYFHSIPAAQLTAIHVQGTEESCAQNNLVMSLIDTREPYLAGLDHRFCLFEILVD